MFEDQVETKELIQEENYYRTAKLGAIFIAVAAFLCGISLNLTSNDIETKYNWSVYFSGLMFYLVGTYYFSYLLGRWPNITSLFLMIGTMGGSISLWNVGLEQFPLEPDSTTNPLFLWALIQITALFPMFLGCVDGYKNKIITKYKLKGSKYSLSELIKIDDEKKEIKRKGDTNN